MDETVEALESLTMERDVVPPADVVQHDASDDLPSAPDGECVVCMDSESTHAAIPCGHMCLCDACRPRVEQQSPCPVCRAACVAVVRIYRS